jgi:hypothetical protein
MLNNGNKGCEFSDEIVSYIYDEIDTAGRRKFESHLALCTSCNDEFAGISDARFSMFEWRKEEFAHLSTPEIVIPYAAKHRDVETAESTGFFAGLTAMLAFVRSPMAIGAGLVVLLGLGFVTFTLVRSGDSNMVASNRNVPPVATPANVYVGNEVTAVNPDPVDSKAPVAKSDDRDDGPTPVKASDRRQKAVRSNPSNQRRLENQNRFARKAPRLSGDGDDDDDSLRLADMFDEIGG